VTLWVMAPCNFVVVCNSVSEGHVGSIFGVGKIDSLIFIIQEITVFVMIVL